VLADGNEIASETMLNIGSESFSIPVDIGERIDVIYNGNGWGQYHNYSITDPSGNVIFSSDDWGSPADDPISVYGLNPCGEEPTCGFIEVTFYDAFCDGWYGGNMGVYSESGLEANIFFNPDFDEDGFADYQSFCSRKALVTIDEGEVDFLVSAPVSEPTQCGYAIKNVEGDVVIEETSTNEVPPSTLNFVICESNASNVVEATTLGESMSFFPNPVHTSAQLQGLDAHEVWEVTILNMDGKVVLQQRGLGDEQIDLSSLKAGVYAAHVKQNKLATQIHRFVKL
jgi:hypothetical protein